MWGDNVLRYNIHNFLVISKDIKPQIQKYREVHSKLIFKKSHWHITFKHLTTKIKKILKIARSLKNTEAYYT